MGLAPKVELTVSGGERLSRGLETSRRDQDEGTAVAGVRAVLGEAAGPPLEELFLLRREWAGALEVLAKHHELARALVVRVNHAALVAEHREVRHDRSEVGRRVHRGK